MLRPHFVFCVWVCVCVFVCVPVRELEIELCNKRCAFPDRIAETLTSSTAPLPKKRRLMLLKMQSFLQEEHFRKQNALDYYNPTDGDHEDRSGGCCSFKSFYYYFSPF